ncbi:MAG: zinc-ribbon domain-containing protein [Methylophilales bacterium]|nr:zinc-ribbon domain-containing protein [Methylophilales bacterium]
MSDFITCCPACSTHFKVQEEALAASAGQGRCSACQHVFNAFEHRFEPDSLNAPDEVPIEPSVEAMEDTETIETPSISETYTLEDLAEELLPESPSETPPEPVPDIPVPETLFQKRRINWSGLFKPLVAVTLLSLVLMAQCALFFRSVLVAHYPRSYAVLSASCKVLHCTVELPRRAGLISIEDHNLRSDPEHADVLVLEASIKNIAPYSQAYPLLELTLTAKPDFPVAKRSFSPEDYLAKNTDIAAGIAARTSVNIHLSLGVAGIQSTAYQLIARDAPNLVAP